VFVHEKVVFIKCSSFLESDSGYPLYDYGEGKGKLFGERYEPNIVESVVEMEGVGVY
jgi:hypothetical protein